mgnify:CR=1 FL=1
MHKNKKNLISVLLFFLLAALTFSAICKGNDMTEVAKAVRKMDAWYLFGAMGLGIFFVSAADAALSYEKGWVEDIGKYCGLNDGSSALQIRAGGDWTFHAAVWLSSAKELSWKLYVAFLSGTTVKYSAGDFSFNRDVRAKAVSQYCDRSRAVLRTVSPAETLGGTN